jgi:hypothetical protein
MEWIAVVSAVVRPQYSALKMEAATDGRTTVALGMEQRRARDTAMVP